jgi:orotate phosphoribosyltransferase
MDYGKEIAKAGLNINAIKLRPNDPFTWASGYRMPIYNDNRMFLFDDKDRKLITKGFYDLANGLPFSVIAGTSTSGIPWGALLANEFKSPFIYVRDKPKDHGLKNQIEGIDAESDLEGHVVILIEDLISTGGSSARAVQGIRDANGICNYCLSIFNYGLDKASKVFNNLDPECEVRSLLTYDTLLEIAKETGYIDTQQAKMLAEWRADPFGWGEKYGFPKVER